MANFGKKRHPAYPSVMLFFGNSVGLKPVSFPDVDLFVIETPF
jgi:hypothetical protein